MNQDNFLKELGRSYIVSAFFPSAFFVSLGILLFRGFIPKALATQLSSNILREWGGQWIISIILMLWVAFLLYTANDVTVKFFEGYFLPGFLKRFMKWAFHSRWSAKAIKEYDAFLILKSRLGKKEEKGKKPSQRFSNKYYQQYQKARTELQRHEIDGPYKYESVLPTRLGNVLRASELYASDRYFIDELTIWPRLFPLMPQDFIKVIEEQHNHLLFLLNSALLAYANAAISIGFAVIGFLIHLFENTSLYAFIQSHSGFFYIGFDNVSPLGFFCIGAVLIFFGYRLYKIGVNVAEGLGLYTRSAFDLYREDLLKQLNWKLPETLEEEKDIWEKVSLYFSTGNRLAEADFPEYCYYNKDGLEIKNTPLETGRQRKFEN